MKTDTFTFTEGNDYERYGDDLLTTFDGAGKVLNFLEAGGISLREPDDTDLIDEYATKLLPQIKAWDGISKVKIPADALKA